MVLATTFCYLGMQSSDHVTCYFSLYSLFIYTYVDKDYHILWRSLLQKNSNIIWPLPYTEVIQYNLEMTACIYNKKALQFYKYIYCMKDSEKERKRRKEEERKQSVFMHLYLRVFVCPHLCLLNLTLYIVIRINWRVI